MKPALFNTEMVRAILDGRKTETRRVVKPQPKYAAMTQAGLLTSDNPITLENGLVVTKSGSVTILDKLPYCPGDILYVRETFFEYKGRYYFKADGKHEELDKMGICFKWHPSIHMPKEAARLILRVKDVRVERLQDIDYDGCKAEGIRDDYKTHSEQYHDVLARRAYPVVFSELWDSTIKPADLDLYGWAANPWVWVIEFERVTREEAENG